MTRGMGGHAASAIFDEIQLAIELSRHATLFVLSRIGAGKYPRLTASKSQLRDIDVRSTTALIGNRCSTFSGDFIAVLVLREPCWLRLDRNVLPWS